MNFWDVDKGRESLAVVETDGSEYTYAMLAKQVAHHEQSLGALGDRTFGFILCDNSLSDLVLYLACLRSGHVPLLLQSAMPTEQLAELEKLYQPKWVSQRGVPIPRPGAVDVNLHKDLGLLLSTSGTTGSPRLVRLSRQALQANAESIARYLGLGKQERAIVSLPMHYSYGLSVINSHLMVGATLVLNSESILSREFLERMREQRVTSLAGVPYMYQMLYRTAFFDQELPALRTLSQAGGRLDERLIRIVDNYAKASGRRFFVMYGQTEASARISYVPPERLSQKIGAIGVPIPGGALDVDPDNGELVYRGSNVMLGYAMNREDLARGDDCEGCLRTGDIGRVDDEGFFYITGRLKRFVKVNGNRIGLDEVESALSKLLSVDLAVGGSDDRLTVWIEGGDTILLDKVRVFLRQKYNIHPSMTFLKLVEQLPLLQTGKKNYGALSDVQ